MHYVRKWNMYISQESAKPALEKFLLMCTETCIRTISAVRFVLYWQNNKAKPKKTLKISLGGKINCGMFIYQCGTFITSYLDEMNISHAEVRLAKEYIPCITYISQNTRKMKYSIYYLQLYTCCKPQRKWEGIHRRILAK